MILNIELSESGSFSRRISKIYSQDISISKESTELDLSEVLLKFRNEAIGFCEKSVVVLLSERNQLFPEERIIVSNNGGYALTQGQIPPPFNMRENFIRNYFNSLKLFIEDPARIGNRNLKVLMSTETINLLKFK